MSKYNNDGLNGLGILSSSSASVRNSSLYGEELYPISQSTDIPNEKQKSSKTSNDSFCFPVSKKVILLPLFMPRNCAKFFVLSSYAKRTCFSLRGKNFET